MVLKGKGLPEPQRGGGEGRAANAGGKGGGKKTEAEAAGGKGGKGGKKRGWHEKPKPLPSKGWSATADPMDAPRGRKYAKG